MKKFIMLMWGVFLLLNSPLYAQQVTKVGTTAAGFLNIDVGAKAVAMGGSFVSVADDATAIYWNSAGIGRFTRPHAVFSHTNWIADIAFNFAAITLPVGNAGTLGINATFLTMGEMEKTTINQPDGTGEMFSAGSYAFGIAFARSLTDRFSIGANLKYINEHIYHSRAQGIALDIGTLFITQFNGLKIGMNISNFGTKMRMEGRDLLVQHDIDQTIHGNNQNINANLSTDSYDIPLMFRVGISMDVLKGYANSNLVLSIDALHPNDDTESINVGAEYLFYKRFALRAGYKSLFARDSEEGVSFGAGFNYDLMGKVSLRVNYAYATFGILNDIQQFNVELIF